MDNKTLNQKLKMRAVQLGLCAQWTSEWKSEESQDFLIKKYKKGIDFCIEHNYPNNEFIKANFSRELLLKNNVFVDEVIDMDGSSGTYIVNGSSNGTIRFNGYVAATLYVRHKSNISIVCSEHSKVFVSLLDDAILNVVQSDMAKCYTYVKSDSSTLMTLGEVLVRR